ncbi:hypothetical protein HMPREF9997_01951 [Corynebacterium durum F0235]|uniref:Uncharacterized protein n=1 Tax=Corynebacterium durum F0235 TaxID=1035195 RepID=L1MDR6_9CORY|nr:hypothetical protein HMPREF9997_01951 [Corynebacterium durum F0235]
MFSRAKPASFSRNILGCLGGSVKLSNACRRFSNEPIQYTPELQGNNNHMQ